MTARGPAKITVEEMMELTRAEILWAVNQGFSVSHLEDGYAVARAACDHTALRPGGTVSGPLIMGLGDYAMYAAVLSGIGRVDLAVTTSLNVNFLKRPPPGDLTAHAALIKKGKRLVVGEVKVYSDGDAGGDMVAHITSTYSIPPPGD